MKSPIEVDKKQQSIARRIVFFFGISITAIILICGVTVLLIRSALMTDRREPNPVMPGVVVRSFNELPGDRAYPEAITIGPDGNIYVGSFCTGDIWKITPEGERELWSKGGEDRVRAASGMVFGPDGFLYVADHGDCNPRRSTSSIKRISADGQTIEVFGNINKNDIPNSLVFDSEGSLYLTDTQNGTIRRLDEDGRFGTWWLLPDISKEARPTGLAYDASTDTLIVADTNSGSIYRIGFTEDREPLTEQLIYRNDSRELDGLAVDENGRIYVTIFNQNEVAVLQADESGLDVLAGDFREPSDIAYLDGVLYVTNFDSLSLAPLLGLIIDPALPFSVDAIELPPLSDEVESQSIEILG